MEIKLGLSALVTGGASRIGKALSLALGTKGVFVTVVDFLDEKGKEVASLIEEENVKFHSKLEFPTSLFIRCDVTNSRDLVAAFEKHVATYGGLDICINSAGITTSIPFYKDQTDGTHSWRHTVEVDLVAVIDCTWLAFVETGMGLTADAKLVGIVEGFVSMQMVLLSSLRMRAKLALVYG